MVYGRKNLRINTPYPLRLSQAPQRPYNGGDANRIHIWPSAYINRTADFLAASAAKNILLPHRRQ